MAFFISMAALGSYRVDSVSEMFVYGNTLYCILIKKKKNPPIVWVPY